jgi:hypothetical protein
MIPMAGQAFITSTQGKKRKGSKRKPCRTPFITKALLKSKAVHRYALSFGLALQVLSADSI